MDHVIANIVYTLQDRFEIDREPDVGVVDIRGVFTDGLKQKLMLLVLNWSRVKWVSDDWRKIREEGGREDHASWHEPEDDANHYWGGE